MIWKLDIQHHQLLTSDTDKLQTLTLDHIEGNNLFTILLSSPEIISPDCGLQEASSTAATLELKVFGFSPPLQRAHGEAASTTVARPTYPVPQLQGKSRPLQGIDR